MVKKLSVWQHLIFHEKLSTRANLQLLWVIISAIGNFWPFWTPIWRPGCLQKESNFLICPNWVIVSNLWSEIISLCKFAVSGGLPLQTWAIFDSFWPLGSPKKSQHLWFVQNEWKYKICDQNLCLCANFQLLGVIFWEMENFWPFCPHWPLGCPKKCQKMWFDKYKYHN